MAENFLTYFYKLKNIETFSLRKVNLESMEQINFQYFYKLKKLDLAYNNLTCLLYVSFQNLKILEYLDVSFNQIDFVDGRIFDDWGDFKEKPLKYLNLESNRIKKFEGAFVNFINLNKLIARNNDLIDYPKFRFAFKSGQSVSFYHLYLNFNRLKSLSYLPYEMCSLLFLNFDDNQISKIASNTFVQMKTLRNLSIASNYLTNVTKEIFYFQFQLKYLNLSHNRE